MALEKADSEMPDLILLDVVMPGKNGIEICKILKGNAKTKHIPVLIFTASGRDVEDLVAQAGADGYFPKLFNPEDLLAEVKKRLDQVKASKS
jgi:DNA-binding response OmpR family regulator